MVQEIDDAHLWYLRSMPGPMLLVSATTGMLFDALAGHKSVHIIDVGFMLGNYMPILLRRLATQPGGGPKVRALGPLRALEPLVGDSLLHIVQCAAIALFRPSLELAVTFLGSTRTASLAGSHSRLCSEQRVSLLTASFLAVLLLLLGSRCMRLSIG